MSERELGKVLDSSRILRFLESEASFQNTSTQQRRAQMQSSNDTTLHGSSIRGKNRMNGLAASAPAAPSDQALGEKRKKKEQTQEPVLTKTRHNAPAHAAALDRERGNEQKAKKKFSQGLDSTNVNSIHVQHTGTGGFGNRLLALIPWVAIARTSGSPSD